jgi:protocatechuate 3,4-dioxygenase beta subunit
MKRWLQRCALLLAGMVVCSLTAAMTVGAASCAPTAPDQLGPFYQPGAPVRSSVGKGYVMTGTVRSSSRDCSAIPGAVIEFWLAGPDGEYHDEQRATVIAGPRGSFRFESNYPPAYYGRPPHIHLRVSAKGFLTLVTQHYPEPGRRDANFDVVLVPLK